MNFLELWASTVLGAVLVYVAGISLFPDINQWVLLPACMVGAFVGSEVNYFIITGHIGGRVAKRNSDDSGD
jgi:membrane protein DedA with SNARE-associated domain